MKNLIILFIFISTASTAQVVNRLRDSTVISGNLQISGGLRIPASAGSGKVLTSGATGIATWQTPSVSGWALTGNSGTNPATNFVGTTDGKSLVVQAGEPTSAFGSIIKLYGEDEGVAYGYMATLDSIANTSSGAYVGSNDLRLQTSNFAGDTLSVISVKVDSIGFSFEPFSAQFSIFPIGIKYNNGTQGAGKVLTSDTNGLATWQTLSSGSFAGIPEYANNAAAVAAIGVGKLYYTDESGEYVLKLSH